MMPPSIYSDYSDNVSTMNRNNKGHNNNNSVIEKVSDTYKERIRLLEDQIALLGASIERKEAELQKKDDKLRKLVLEMDSARQEAVKDLLRQKNKVSE
jgi:flagellar capping protein FliD